MNGTRGRSNNRQACLICDTLAPGELIELDLVLADPLRWPATVWGNFAPPQGGMPASYRRFGAERMGTEWLMANGYDIGKAILRAHIRYDVPVLEVSVDELVQRGLIALTTNPKGHGAGASQLGTPIDPLLYITFYNEGIRIGVQALGLLSERVKKLIDKGEEVPLVLIKMMMDAGLKMAMSQAAIKAAGKPFGDEGGDENDAFRGGDDISPRFAGNRVRTIEGEARPVADEGPADRAHYNERAAQEGGIRIGGR